MPTAAKTAPAKAQRKPLPKKAAQQPVTEVGGVEVIREETVEHLPGAPFKSFVRLQLADGEHTYKCGDCRFVGTRGEIYAHRNKSHGARIGKNRVGQQEETLLDDLTDPAPDVSAMEMTLAEIISIAPSIKAMGDLVDKVEDERDEAVAELKEMERAYNRDRHKIVGFDAMRDEVSELRSRVRSMQPKVERYDTWKAELVELRAWKKKMVAKLSALGFNLNEDD